VAGRVVDWGELPGERELFERTVRAAERRPPPRGGPALVAKEEVDEIRIVHSWIAANEPPMLSLDEEPTPALLRHFVNAPPVTRSVCAAPGRGTQTRDTEGG